MRLMMLVAGAASALLTTATVAQERPSVANSFPLGNGGDTACTVQTLAPDEIASGVFDRVYTVVCRDAVAPVANIYALRDPAAARAKLEAARDPRVVCPEPSAIDLKESGQGEIRSCKADDELFYDVVSLTKGRTLFQAEGLAGYRSAITLAIRALAEDRIIAEPVTIARTEAGDPLSFARAQAGALDPELTLIEGYRRNATGNYAEAAEFFDTLVQSAEGASKANLTEYLVNRALQKSNLGDFDEAEALFARAAALPTSDPVVVRLRRNYLAMHRLNQRRPKDAAAALAMAVEPVPVPALDRPVIDESTADALNSRVPLARQLGVATAAALTPLEKAAILDAQATALRGVIARLEGNRSGAEVAYLAALTQIASVRGGQVTSTARLRAAILGEQAELAEEAGNRARALQLLGDAHTIVEQTYPGSQAANAARARLAAATARSGDTQGALALYGQVVAQLGETGASAPGMEQLLEPYFGLLVAELPRNPAMSEQIFLASQTLVRPGVADTQAVLARELSSGDDEAARLFRQSITLTRESEAARIELARFAALAEPTAADQARVAELNDQLAELQATQAATVGKLSQYPSFRALSNRALTLGELREQLAADEGYWKMLVVDQSVYAFYATKTGFAAWKAAIDRDMLDTTVSKIRESISTVENGRTVTYPFDVVATRALYQTLAGPMQAEIASAKGIVFEPDGGMLRLPPKLLIVDQAGVDRYLARNRNPNADPFDFTGIEWLGRRLPVTIAVSPRAFRDVRSATRSKAAKVYLGLGENAPVNPFARLTAIPVSANGGIDCSWPLSVWGHPISDAELRTAAQLIGPQNATVITDAAFTDRAIAERPDLNQYRIIHFATHGLIAAPRPECPARPALLTSFGGADSDGLLSFREIYDLKLDADLVILSACNTAAGADVRATREAGLTTGGGDPLDGLVRAFVGAGARTVVASHWPAPDDFKATERLIGGLFTAPPGTSIGQALLVTQRTLQDDPATSHPYYWAGFVLIGDGSKPVLDAR